MAQKFPIATISRALMPLIITGILTMEDLLQAAYPSVKEGHTENCRIKGKRELSLESGTSQDIRY